MTFFHFGSYISISPLLVPNQLTHVILVIFVSQSMEIIELINGEIKILLKIYYSTHQIKKKKKKKKQNNNNNNNNKIDVHLQQEHQRTQTLYFNIIVGNLNI